MSEYQDLVFDQWVESFTDPEDDDIDDLAFDPMYRALSATRDSDSCVG